MANAQISDIAGVESTSVTDTDLFEGEESGGTSFQVAFSVIKSTLQTAFDALYAGIAQDTNKKTGVIWNPNSLYGDDTQVIIFRADAALTITRIHISGPNASPTSELDIDLKWADDTTAFTNAAVIDVCDTTSGVVTITSSFDDATIDSGKYVYWEFGAQPHADWLWMWFEVYYTYD